MGAKMVGVQHETLPMASATSICSRSHLTHFAAASMPLRTNVYVQPRDRYVVRYESMPTTATSQAYGTILDLQAGDSTVEWSISACFQETAAGMSMENAMRSTTAQLPMS